MKTDEIKELKKEIEKIKERNTRVEKNKAWETSWTRRIIIAISTYILVVLVFATLHFDRPFLGAIVPVVAYSISTSSLEFFKERWIKNQR